MSTHHCSEWPTSVASHTSAHFNQTIRLSAEDLSVSLTETHTHMRFYWRQLVLKHADQENVIKKDSRTVAQLNRMFYLCVSEVCGFCKLSRRPRISLPICSRYSWILVQSQNLPDMHSQLISWTLMLLSWTVSSLTSSSRKGYAP